MHSLPLDGLASFEARLSGWVIAHRDQPGCYCEVYLRPGADHGSLQRPQPVVMRVVLAVGGAQGGGREDFDLYGSLWRRETGTLWGSFHDMRHADAIKGREWEGRITEQGARWLLLTATAAAHALGGEYERSVWSTLGLAVPGMGPPPGIIPFPSLLFGRRHHRPE